MSPLFERVAGLLQTIGHRKLIRSPSSVGIYLPSTCQVWYPMTVATNSREHKKIIAQYFDKTGCSRDPDASAFMFKLHDFGYRGVSSVESAALGGAAHLCNFNGTDTVAGIQLIKAYYNELDGNFVMPGFSIPAAEHSTITSWGRDGESAAMKNMLEQVSTPREGGDHVGFAGLCEKMWTRDPRGPLRLFRVFL